MSATHLAGILNADRGDTKRPNLERGLCIGQWDLFDADGDNPAAAELAQSLCRQCPVLDRCSEWVSSLPKSKRPIGVVAGEWRPEPRRRKRAS